VTTSTVLAIDVGGTKISLCVASSSGDVLASRRIPTSSEDGARAVIARLNVAARALIDDVGAQSNADICGVGIVTPGVVQPDSVQLAPNNKGWDEIALARTVGNLLGLAAVRADNDAKAATAAEARWGVLSGVSDGILLNLGTGISAGAVVGGMLLRGAHGAALEIAYQISSTGPVRGFRDGRAPLEESFSGSGLESAASDLLGRKAGAGEVFAAMAAARTRKGLAPESPGDIDRLAELGQRALETAARAVANLAIAFDPEVVALSGGMLRSAALIVPELRDALDRLVPFPPRLALAHFAELAPLAGACLLAFQTAGLTEPDQLQLDGSPVGAVPADPATTQEEPAERSCE
jgi:glucokinase